MVTKIQELIEKRATNWTRMKELNDLPELTGEMRSEYDGLEKDVDSWSDEIERITRFDRRATTFEGVAGEQRGNGRPPIDAGIEEAEAEKRAKDMADFRSVVKGEKRAFQADDDTSGGYLLTPQTVATALIKAVDNATFMRTICHKETITTSESLGVVSMDTDIDDADWTPEIVAIAEASALRLGRRALTPHQLAKLVKLSRTLVRKTAGGAETLVINRLAYKFGITMENQYLNGDGAEKPLGVFTASALGISTGRDVSTGNTTTAFTADGLIEAKHSVKAQYWDRGRWMFHRDGIKMARKLKDGNGQYLWAPGMSGGVPNTIFDSPYLISEYVPNTFTTGLYVGIFGDFEFYWIVDALQLEIQVLNELYAPTSQFGYIGRLETDGMPVLEEAFARVKLA